MSKSYQYLSLSYAELALKILLSIILARFLGVENFGSLQTYIVLSTIILPAINIKYDEVVLKDIKKYNNYSSVRNYILSEYLLVFIVYGLVCVFFEDVIVLLNLQAGTLSPFIILFAALAYLPTSLDGFLRASGKEMSIQVSKTLCASLSLIAVCLSLFVWKLSYASIFVILISFNAVLIVFLYKIYFSLRPPTSTGRIVDNKVVQDGLLATFNNVLSIALKSGSVFAAVLIGPVAVALYRVSDSISQLAYFSATALYRLNFTSIMGGKLSKKERLNKKVYVIVVLNFIGLVIFLKPLLLLVYGEDYVSAYYSTLILSFSYVLCSFIYAAPAYVFEKREGLQYQIKVRFIFLIFLLPLTYFLVQGFGLIGLAISISFVRFGIMYVFHCWSQKK